MPRLLIVEENPDRAEAIRLMLNFAMYDSDVVEDGHKALAYLENGILPDVILANLICGGLDGLRLTRMVKSNAAWAYLPVLLIGEANSDALAEELARRCGALFLHRPFQRDQFLADIDQAMLLGPVQENPLARPHPQEEVTFLRDYTTWLTNTLYHAHSQWEHTQQDLDLRTAHVYAMNTLTTALGDNLDLQATAQTITSKAAEILRAHAAAIYIYDDQAHEFGLAHNLGLGMPTPHLVSGYIVDEESPLWRLTERDKALLFARNSEIRALQQHLALEIAPTSAIVTPLIAQGNINGFLLLMRADSTDPFTQQEAKTLFSLAGAAGLALRSAYLFHQLEVAFDNLKELDRRKSEFVAITSHELRTPLAIMLGYANLLHDIEDDPQKKTQLATIEKQATFLSGLVDTLLNLQELTNTTDPIRLRCNPIQLDALLKDALAVTKEHRGSPTEMDFVIDCDPIQIEGDEIRLLLAFNNLFENAIKFSSPNAPISLKVAEKPTGGVIVTLQDQGIGIAEEHYDKIFEPFFQVEAAMTRHHGGLGLGLAIVKGVIELHAGTITVKSKLGEGTRFVIELPSKLPEDRCSSGGF